MKIYLSLVLFVAGSVCAANNISSSGKARLEQNLRVLDENVKHTESNVAATRKNIHTVNEELKDLDKLEADHAELKKKYASYLRTAEGEMDKNEKVIHDLKKYEEKLTLLMKNKTATPKQLMDFDKAKRDRSDRERWMAESKKKVEKITELQGKLNRNIASINSRRGPLRKQRQSWQEKQRGYENLLKELHAKKVETANLLKD
jgi:septal ring factor EnvC (AmiA/AmiB activator)